MSHHNFEDPIERGKKDKFSHRSELTQKSGSLVAQLAAFKGVFDTVIADSSVPEKADLNAAFLAFTNDVKTTLGI